MTKAQKTERDEAIERLRGWLRPGQTVYTVLRHVSRSGMQRVIDVKCVDGDADISNLGYNVALALGWRWNDKQSGVVVDGCGMDTGFHLVYNLGTVLWPKGTDKPHGRRNGEPDSDGGYALKHRWI